MAKAQPGAAGKAAKNKKFKKRERKVVPYGVVYIQAGGGIVADSSPEHELAETRAKAEGMLRALRAPA